MSGISCIDDIKNIWVYDLEVFIKDWTACFLSVDTGEIKTFHNDKSGLCEFINSTKPILCGYNNGGYDNYVLLTMLTDGTTESTKEINDYIIGGNQGWSYPKNKGKYIGNYITGSIDLMQDTPMGLSLKACEANLGLSIVESTVDFTIDRKLTPTEVEEVLYYNTHDVKCTYELLKVRKNYLNGKITVANLCGLDPVKALGMTNAKLTASFLNATKLDNAEKDEFIIPIVDSVPIKKYTEVLDFFKSFEYGKSLTVNARDLDITIGNGGVHGSVECSQLIATDTRKIIEADVTSLYPSLMIEYNYTSEAIPSAEHFKDVYNTRVKAKHDGNKAVSDALKLVLNTTYGATKNKYNPLYDPKQCNRICATGTMFLILLTEWLEDVPTLTIVQVNTDAVCYMVDAEYEKQAEEIVHQWEAFTRLKMEFIHINQWYIKDVNNYIMVSDEGLVNKGGYVSLYGGGDFKNNSLSVVHNAVVDYFIKGIPPEDTINKCTDVMAFQMVAKTGRTYDACVYRTPLVDEYVQRVNRVYAGSDESLGTLYKKKGDRYDKIASLPTKCIIDNTGEKVSIDDIDKEFYISMAWSRINDYKGIKETKNKKVSKKKEKTMATKKEELNNVYVKLAKARALLRTKKMEKSGKNAHMKYKYYTLDDIVPVAEACLLANELMFQISFSNGGECAYGTIIDVTNPSDKICFVTPCSIEAVNSGSNNLQAIGSAHTYLRRYLWLLALDIVEVDLYEENLGATTPQKPTANKTDVLHSDDNEPCNETRKNAIRNGLKQLQASGTDNDFVTDVVNQMKKGVTNAQAEAIISEIKGKL